MELVKNLAQAEHCIALEDKIENLKEIMETLMLDTIEEMMNGPTLK